MSTSEHLPLTAAQQHGTPKRLGRSERVDVSEHYAPEREKGRGPSDGPSAASVLWERKA